MVVITFWLALLGAVFSYFIYPIVLMLIPKRQVKDFGQETPDSPPPKISLIVTAYNEESRIREKIKNCLEIDYPDLEILIASDCSSDQTDEIVGEFRGKNVVLARATERKGKENAQLQAIGKSTGDIVVFSDVATTIPADALRKLVRYFDDPDVGAVSSEDRFVSRDGGIVGEGAYVRYEMWLRRLESSRAGIVGLSGSFFAARRDVCEVDWDIYSPSDFNTALNCARKGVVAVTAPDVVGIYTDVSDPQKEYQRKIRTVIRGWTALSRHLEVLNPSKFGLFAFQVFGHKLMRWAVPWFLVLLFITSIALAGKGAFYTLALLGQAAFYGLVLAGHFSPDLRAQALIKIPYFFVQVNIAIAHATVFFLTGRRMTVWTPSKR
ncbi:glycosyltransferase family 2 protein [Marinobacter zhejiangensis]|uniref:Glycosyltransferase, catalytic subunit of cellulose synthase and poly-beta-1,6-N-acetylglucosamine synthase n=1 Tax=Marinobacter zhejiangensis TaxID=488535 RepID=A0A1I4RP73_9GAMM|nr:glycosyltransferase family 2 protein [Marinobacter zhejiangensis]SFM53753.1 Glycosyltransferase, catalytic subunit of cellulose synthase and poly-beta-1,6-N-acetylglucosamine synthase [Marinobacter zhejiangensis]